MNSIVAGGMLKFSDRHDFRKLIETLRDYSARFVIESEFHTPELQILIRHEITNRGFQDFSTSPFFHIFFSIIELQIQTIDQ